MKRIISLLLSVVLVLSLVTANAVPVSAESDFVISDECVELLKSMEGFDKYPRWDYSQWTVGHGSRCPDEDLERYRANGITYEEADALLRKHANTFAKSINSFIDKYDLDFTQQQFDAVLLFTYNFGTAWIFKESSSWRAGLINGLTGNDFLYEIGQWCHAGGEILKPLITRRLIETNIFFNGVYSRTVPDNYCYVIFEFNGGDGESDVQAYDSNLENPIRVIPTREGYTFIGWYTANVGGRKITELSRDTKNITLYARWAEGENVDIEDLPPQEEDPEGPRPIDPLKLTVEANGVNIRTGPGTNYSVVGALYSGDTVTITEVQYGTGYTWGKYAENRWIALMFTNYDELIGQTPEEEVPGEETPKEEEPEVETPDEEIPEETIPEKPVGSQQMNPVKVYIEVDGVNVRTGPGTNYPVVGTVYAGKVLTITEIQDGITYTWGKFGEDRWIALTFTNYDEMVSKNPGKDPTQPGIPGATPQEPPVSDEICLTGTVNTSDLRIRSGAGTNYPVIGLLQTGDSVTITERKTVGSMEWGKMDLGWISLAYVTLDESNEEEQPTPPVDEEQPEKDPAQPLTGRINVVESLRIRSGAGINYTIVGFYGPDDVVTILETKTVSGMTWGRTDRGWISLDYVIFDENVAPEAPETPEEPVAITGKVDVQDSLRVRSGPGTGYDIVGFLYRDDVVTITETKVVSGMTWGKISNGWISMDYIILD